MRNTLGRPCWPATAGKSSKLFFFVSCDYRNKTKEKGVISDVVFFLVAKSEDISIAFDLTPLISFSRYKHASCHVTKLPFRAEGPSNGMLLGVPTAFSPLNKISPALSRCS